MRVYVDSEEAADENPASFKAGRPKVKGGRSNGLEFEILVPLVIEYSATGSKLSKIPKFSSAGIIKVRSYLPISISPKQPVGARFSRSPPTKSDVPAVISVANYFLIYIFERICLVCTDNSTYNVR